MTKPTERQLAEIRQGIKNDVDLIVDSWPAILDAAATYYRPSQHDDPEAEGRQAGTHSDPTGQQAFKANPAAAWSKRARHVIAELHGLAAALDRIIGPEACRHCTKPIGDEPSVTAHGRKLHRKCYDAGRRR